MIAHRHDVQFAYRPLWAANVQAEGGGADSGLAERGRIEHAVRRSGKVRDAAAAG